MRTNLFVESLVREPHFRSRYHTDPEGECRRFGLSPAETVALMSHDDAALAEFGLHPVLRFALRRVGKAGGRSRSSVAQYQNTPWPALDDETPVPEEFAPERASRRGAKTGLVACWGTSHIVMSAEGVESQVRSVMRGFREIAAACRRAAVDAIVVIAADHFSAISHAGTPHAVIAGAAAHRGAGDLALPEYEVPGWPAMADALARACAREGIPGAAVQPLPISLDHGVVLPLHFVRPSMDVPVLAILLNTLVSPMPTLQWCAAFGSALSAAIDDIIASGPWERVAVLGTGGLSHWINTARMGDVAEDFDQWFCSCLTSGKLELVLEFPEDQIEDVAGNGGQEVRTWITAAACAGASGGSGGRLVYYEPVAKWLTGMAAIEFESGTEKLAAVGAQSGT